MWQLYDSLIDGIPSHLTAGQIHAGIHYALVQSSEGCGISEVKDYSFRKPISSTNLVGKPLKDIAALIKSWNFVEASIGLAAINAHYNSIATARANGVTISDSMHAEDRIFDPFLMCQNEVKNSVVTVLGHFPHILKLLGPVCRLRIIAGETPADDDYPPTAASYLIPESDYVFLSSAALIDKTLPSLLQMAAGVKKTTIVGPSTTLCPALFDFGIHDLSGFVIKDCCKAACIAQGSDNSKIFTAGQKVSFKTEQYIKTGAKNV
jgi:uncharacterized protein (DUF4213/DUF364 family)